MGSFSLVHWLVVLAIILLLFGANRLPQVMGDFAKGIKAFKSGMKENEEADAARPAPPPLDQPRQTAPLGSADQPRERV
jgi:sec-independent protein translocase protein TatA